MAKKIVGFWDRLEFFLLSDDEARWKAIGWIIVVVGVCGSIDLALLGSSVEDAVLLMGVLIVILSVLWIWLYCRSRQSTSTDKEPLHPTGLRRVTARKESFDMNMDLNLEYVENWSIWLDLKILWFSRRAFVFQAGTLAAFILSLLLPRAEAREVEHKLQQASDNPLDPESAGVAQKTLAAARRGFLKIDSRIVRDTGAKFVQTAEPNSGAWSAVQEYLGYRSFLNADFVPALTPATGTSKYRSSVKITALQPNFEHRPAFEVFFAGGYANGDESARLESLSNPQPDGSEFAYFIVDGGAATIGLDDAYMRNVIIRNSNISYAGGQVKLENVWFINCTFDAFVRVVPETKKLGNAILAYSRPVTFQN
jgi:hypothetical protein